MEPDSAASRDDHVSGRLALRHEGLLLDDYYGAKAMTVQVVACGRRTDTGRVLAHRWCGGRPRRTDARSILMASTRRSGPPQGSAARELIDSGFALENADAPFLHQGLNLADIAHVLDLLRRGSSGRRRPHRLLLEVEQMDAEDFPYDPEFEEPTRASASSWSGSARSRDGARRAARREAARIALRIYVRDQLLELRLKSSPWRDGARPPARRHLDARPDLPAASPAVDVRSLRVVVRLPCRSRCHRCSTSSTTSTAAGAGCVSGTRLLDDRTYVAAALGFDEVIEHTRDAMWQIDGLIHVLASAGLLSTQSKLAEDLEIWSSNEFDFVALADGYTRSSILMPQKRNPYSLSIVRGASGF